MAPRSTATASSSIVIRRTRRHGERSESLIVGVTEAERHMAKTKKKPSQARVGNRVTLRRSIEKGTPTPATTGAKRKKARRTAASKMQKARR